MSISAYTGLPGSGKSYGMFKNVIIPALIKGRTVWTNIPFNEDACIERFGCSPVLFTMDEVKENENWFQEVFPKGAICVLDEVWRLWPSGMKANLVPDGYKSFLAEHRHMVCENGFSTEIILGTQDLTQIAAFARDLVEQTFRSVKLTVIGSSKRYRVDCYSGPASGPNPPKSRLVNQFTGKYKSDVYELYSSHTMSDTGLAGDESKSDDRTNIFKSSYLPAAVVFIALMLFVAYMGLSTVFGFFFGESEKELVTDSDKVGVVSSTVTSDSVKESVIKRIASSVAIENSIPDVLEDRSIYIQYNNGLKPNIDYVFRVERGDQYYTLNNKDMVMLGYRLRAVSGCLAILTSVDKQYIATCLKDSDSVLEDIITPSENTNESTGA